MFYNLYNKLFLHEKLVPGGRPKNISLSVMLLSNFKTWNSTISPGASLKKKLTIQ